MDRAGTSPAAPNRRAGPGSRALPIAILILAILVAVPACGGGGGGATTDDDVPIFQPPLSEEEYQQGLTQVAEDYLAAMGSLPDAAALADAAAAAQTIRDAQAVVAQVAEDLDVLEAPTATAALHGKLTTGMRNLAQGLSQYAAAVDEGKTTTIGTYSNGLVSGTLPVMVQVNQAIRSLQDAGYTFGPAA